MTQKEHVILDWETALSTTFLDWETALSTTLSMDGEAESESKVEKPKQEDKQQFSTGMTVKEYHT